MDFFGERVAMPGGNRGERLFPRRSAQLAVLAQPGTVEPPALQPVDGKARLVAEPFLIHVVVDARQNA
ncbi:MAG: hypothetical protein B7Z73_19255, partial [Planctomycetia bacterium 21-64-5]